jgi:hypothetical protein
VSSFMRFVQLQVHLGSNAPWFKYNSFHKNY